MEEVVQKQIIRLSTMKLKPYKKVIKKLLKIEEQGIVSDEDYRRLCALFKGRILMHLKKNYAEEIVGNLIVIGRCVGMGSEDARLYKELRTPVLTIINVLMRDMGFGGELDESIINGLEKAEDEYFPRLFKQAIKEALDNVLVNYSDYCLLNRGEYIQKEDGEYIVFPFVNRFPYGCKIMVGPFTNKENAEICFQLYVPRYLHKAESVLADDNITSPDGFIYIITGDNHMPASVSLPLNDFIRIELEQEDSFNKRVSSFSFEDAGSLAGYRRNYAEVAFALGQRVKYIYLNSCVALNAMYLHEFIAWLGKIDRTALYPYFSWKLNEAGDIVPIDA